MGGPPQFQPGDSQPPCYGQPAMYGQPTYYDEPRRRHGMSNGAQVAMAAAGGLAVGAAGMYAVEHMDDIGHGLQGAGEWVGDAAGDVGHFFEERFEDIF